MATESLYQYSSGSGKYAQGTLTYTTGPTVTVNITSANAGWRIRGSNSNPDTSERISGYGTGTYTFNAVDGESLAFQVYCTAEESYVGGQTFTINFGNSSGGSEGGSSGSGSIDESTPFRIYINIGTGVKDVKIERTWSDYGNYTGKNGNWNDPVYISNSDYMWYKDSIRITAEPLDGYKLDTYTVDDEQVNFYSNNLYYDNPDINTWRVRSKQDLYIFVTASSLTDDNEDFNFSVQKNCIKLSQATTNYHLYPDSDVLEFSEDAVSDNGATLYSLKFATPKFTGVTQYIDFEFAASFKYPGWQLPIYFAVTSSFDKIPQYCEFAKYNTWINVKPLIGEDPGLIAWSFSNLDIFPEKLRFTTKSLQPNNTYYLLMISGDANNGGYNFNSVHDHIVKIGYSTGIHVDDGVNFELYELYIDNGTSFELYAPYIDNGTTWEPL